MKTAIGLGVVAILVGVAFVYTGGPERPIETTSQKKETITSNQRGAQTQEANTEPASVSRMEFNRMLGRVKALEIDVKELRVRLSRKPDRGVVEARPQKQSQAPRRASGSGAVTVDALKREDSKARAVVEQMVTDAMRNQRAERRELRRAFWVARSEDKLADFAKKAEISDEMTAQITEVLEEERKKIGSQYRQMRATLDVREGREAIKEIRAKTNEAVKGMLTAEQAGMWDEMRKRRGRW